MNQQTNVYREMARSYHSDRLNGAVSRRQLQSGRPDQNEEQVRARFPRLSLVFSGATLAALLIALVG